jgi:hypothetical protein
MTTTGYALPDFARDIERAFEPGRPESFWNCEAALRRLLEAGGPAAWLNRELAALAQDPYYAGDWHAGEVALQRTPCWALSLVLLDGPRRYIHALPYLALYSPLGGSRLEATRYRLPEGYANDVFDPSLRLRKEGQVSAGTGELLRIESDRFAYDFDIRQPVPVLRLASNTLLPLEWLFSKSTLQAWQANDADLRFTQLRVGAYVAGRLAHQSSIEALRRLSTHSHHAVRWAAIQSLGRLDRAEALARIRDALADPHPHVRRAAQKTLDQVERRAAR